MDDVGRIFVYRFLMRFLWDETKPQANLEKHGLDFADVMFFGWETCVISEAHTGRRKAIGRFRDGTAAVIYAMLGAEAVSIISFRPASLKERRQLQWRD
jgi:uncharacterized DUF497 family protein